MKESQGEHRSEWAAISSVAAKLGCGPQTLRKWIRQAEIGYVPPAEFEVMYDPTHGASDKEVCVT